MEILRGPPRKVKGAARERDRGLISDESAWWLERGLWENPCVAPLSTESMRRCFSAPPWGSSDAGSLEV